MISLKAWAYFTGTLGKAARFFCSSVKESPRLVTDRGICSFGRLGNDGAGLEHLLVGEDDSGLHIPLKFPVDLRLELPVREEPRAETRG